MAGRMRRANARFAGKRIDAELESLARNDRMADSTKHDFGFCPVLQQMITEQKWVDDDGSTYPAFGVSTNNNLAVIRSLMMAVGPARTMEIGLSMGGSALTFAQSHKDLGHAPQGQHTAIDPWQKPLLHSIGLKAMERAGLSPYLEFDERTSDLCLPAFLEAGRGFQMIYIDGSHAFEDVFLDCHYCYHLLEPGGLLLFDDCSDPNIAKVLTFVRRNMAYGLTEFDLTAHRPDKGRSVRYRGAKILGLTQLAGFQKSGSGRRPLNYKTRRF